MQRNDPPPNFDDYRLQKLRQFCSANEINGNSVIKLRQLEQFDIVIVCDDSGSMLTPIDDNSLQADPFAKRKTRWDDLCQTVSLVLGLATCLDKTGVDIYFLNRPPLLNVVDVAQVNECFQFPPQGYTPSVRALRNVFENKARILAEGKLLAIFATDGQPTDDNGNVVLQDFVDFVKNKPKNCYLSILACTDDEESVDFLDGFINHNYPQLDVSEVYYKERDEVKQKSGRNLSFGDYVCKVLMGPVDPSFNDKAIMAKKPAAGSNNAPANSGNDQNNNCYCCCFYCPC